MWLIEWINDNPEAFVVILVVVALNVFRVSIAVAAFRKYLR